MKIIRWEVSSRALVVFLCGVSMLIIFAVSLFLRAYLPYGGVFGEDWVRFDAYDPWYRLRLAESILQHFPIRISFDPYTWYPHGQSVPFAPLFDLLLAAVAWVVGLGSPSQQTLEAVAAYLPAVLGALITVPVYFLGRALYNRGVGLIAAALTAVLPGVFLLRSSLGFADYQALASLLSALTILVFVLALKSTEGVSLWDMIREGRWGGLSKPLLYSILAGIALGLFLISWAGGLLLALVLFCYILLQHIIDHLRGRPTSYLSFIGVISFVVALLLLLPFLNQGKLGELHLVSLLVAVAAFLVASAVSRAMRKVGRPLYPLALIVLALAGLGGVYLASPAFFRSMVDGLRAFSPQVAQPATREMVPLLFPEGVFSLAVAWQDFAAVFFVAIIGLVFLFFNVLGEGKAERMLFLVWSLAMLAAILSQRRFGYYFAVNAALLSGYLTWQVLEWARPGRAPRKAMASRGERRRVARLAEARAKKKSLLDKVGWGYILVAVVAAGVLFYPAMTQAVTITRDLEGPNKDWHDSLVWMKENTPEPFEDTDFYYRLYEPPRPGQDYVYPASAYGVMCWGDFGHWVTRIAHRMPVANPQRAGAYEAARFLTSQDEASADAIIDGLGARYVVVDATTMTTKLQAMLALLGKSRTEYVEQYYLKTEDGRLTPVPAFYPEYYRSMGSRLYNFAGKAELAEATSWVISFTEKKDNRGNVYKEIDTYKRFATYDEAQDYLKSQPSPNLRLVGIDPFQSCVPLEELKGYKLVHRSDTPAGQGGQGEEVSYVQIFERLPATSR